MRGLIARLATVVVAFMLASVALLVALGFAMVGVYFVFAQFVSPPWAAFCSALLAIAFAGIVLLVALAFARRPRMLRRSRAASNPNYLAAMLGDVLGSRFRSLASENTRTTIFASFAAGFVVGLSPKLRAFLFDLIR
jgi:hypothetical protein